MTLNRKEAALIASQKSKIENLERKTQRLLDENVTLTRQVEILSDRLNLTDDQRDEVYREAKQD
jgi:regulator of replication initiation timing